MGEKVNENRRHVQAAGNGIVQPGRKHEHFTRITFFVFVREVGIRGSILHSSFVCSILRYWRMDPGDTMRIVIK
jgi:hypothetical protein